MKDYYKILGVSKKASLAEIKKAYRKMARKYHPDLNPDDTAAEKKFKDISEAYEILKNPQKRKQFDTFGDVRANYANMGGSGFSGFNGFNFNQAGSSSFSDIFETIFGRMGGHTQTAEQRTKKPQRGEDLIYSMNLSFTDAARGIETPIQIRRKLHCSECNGTGIDKNSKRMICSSCQGTGRTQRQTGFMQFKAVCSHCKGSGYLPGSPCRKCGGEGLLSETTKIRVKIPAGVDTHSKVRIGGKGNAGLNHGPFGDLIISINVIPHKFFKREGPNLIITLPITFTEAALGAKIEVPTLEGKSLLKIPPSTSSGQKLRLRNKGIIDPKKKIKGDMVVEIKIVPPSIKDIEIRKLLKQIEDISPYNPRRDFN